MVGVCFWLMWLLPGSQSSSAVRFEKPFETRELSHPVVTAMVQDRMGQIWMGTQFGLNVFDGYQVQQVGAMNPAKGKRFELSGQSGKRDTPGWFGDSKQKLRRRFPANTPTPQSESCL